MWRFGDLVSVVNARGILRPHDPCARSGDLAPGSNHHVTTSPNRQIPFCSLWLCVSLLAFPGAAQSLDERLDEEKFLRGLSEYRLPEVLDHYIAERPPANEIDATLYAITVLRMRLSDESLTPEQHRVAVDQVLQARSELIEKHPEDARHGVWLAEQGTDLLFGMYPLEAAGLAAEFGLVSPTHRARAAEVAEQILNLAAAAEVEIEEAVLNLESEPGYREDVAAQMRRRQLVREERDRRIPFLRGAGEYLHSFHNLGEDASAQREGYERAAAILIPIVPELEGAARVRAQVYAALAVARLGRVAEAEEHLRAVEAAGDVTPIDLFAARMGRVAAREALNGPADALRALAEVERLYTGPDDLFFSILLADRKLLLRRAIALSSPAAQRGPLLRSAFEEYLGLLNRAGASRVGEEALRGIIYAKLSSAIDESVPIEDLPPVALIALADNLSQDEARRAEGIALFEQALAEESLDEQARSAALFGLARAHYADGAWLQATRRFDQIARELPNDPQADRALGLAASLLRELYEETPASPEIAEEYERTLTLIVEIRPQHPDVEQWRYAMGLLRYEQGRLDDAAALFEAVAPAAPVSADAAFMLARVARDEAARDETNEAREAAIDAARTARAALDAALKAAPEDERSGSRGDQWREYLALTRIYEATAQLGLGRAEETLALLADFTGTSDVSRAALADALSLRIRAYQITGRTEEARAEVDHFIRSIPEEIDLVVPEMMEALEDDIESLLKQGDVARARERAEADLLPLAEALRSWMARSAVPPADRPALFLQIADAYRLSEQYLDALELYEEALGREPALLPAIFGRAEARFGLTQYEEAIMDYRRISGAQRAELDDYYWRSELRMLQVLDRVNRNTHQIAPRISRLRAVDPDFGGYKLDFEVLEVKYAGQ